MRVCVTSASGKSHSYNTVSSHCFSSAWHALAACSLPGLCAKMVLWMTTKQGTKLLFAQVVFLEGFCPLKLFQVIFWMTEGDFPPSRQRASFVIGVECHHPPHRNQDAQALPCRLSMHRNKDISNFPCCFHTLPSIVFFARLQNAVSCIQISLCSKFSFFLMLFVSFLFAKIIN